jgi:putative ABC transport system permease protein
MRVLLARLKALVRREADDRALVEDIETHLSLLADEYVARGMKADEARYAARKAFGGVDQVRVRHRDQRGFPPVEALIQDLRHAARGLRRQPGFTLGASLTLALAIGLTTAVYSLVYGVLLRPLPYADPDRLVRIWEEHAGAQAIGGNRWLSQHTHEQWMADRRTLSAFGAYTSASGVLRTADVQQALSGAAFTPSLVGVLGVTPALGRWFTDDDAREGADRVIVIAHTLWRDRFGARPDVVGTSVLLDEQPSRIVGVAPASFRFPSDTAQFWSPYAVPTVASEPRRTSGFNGVGRLAESATVAEVASEGTAAARRATRPMSAEVVFGKGGPVVVHARLLRDDVSVAVRPALVALAAAVTLILIVACANVASLLLARAVARQREFAIRTAVGASRGRLVFQTFAESALLACAGGATGVAIAWALVRSLPSIAPDRFPRLLDVQLDTHVLSVAFATTAAAALLAGLVPALRSIDRNAMTGMRSGDGGVGDAFRGRRARQWRDGLLVVESALAVVLLVGALLLGHSLSRLMRVDPGYSPQDVALASIIMPRGAPAERGHAFVDGALQRLRAMPGIAAAGAASTMPMVSTSAITSFPVEPAPGDEPVMTRSLTYTVTPGYAETVGLRLRAGRLFKPEDQRPGVRAIIVNEEFVRRYLRGDAVGRRFARLYVNEKEAPTEIVGVVGNVLKDGYDGEPMPELYFVDRSSTMSLSSFFTLTARVDGDPAAALVALRDVTAAADPGAVIQSADLLADRVAASMAQPRFATLITAAFAAVGVVLASAGLLAVLSYAVAQRRRELSVRAALGAGRGRLLGMVVREALAITTAGILLGLLASAGLTSLLRSLLFQVSPLDPLSFSLAALVLLPSAVAASLLPAFRAAAADPAATLRGE